MFSSFVVKGVAGESAVQLNADTQLAAGAAFLGYHCFCLLILNCFVACGSAAT
jgi:hypothetical protein